MALQTVSMLKMEEGDALCGACRLKNGKRRLLSDCSRLRSERILSRNPLYTHQLHDGKLFDDLDAIETAQPRVFFAAKRHVCLILHQHIINVRHTGPYFVGKSQFSIQITGEYGAGETKFSPIGKLQGVVFVPSGCQLSVRIWYPIPRSSSGLT